MKTPCLALTAFLLMLAGLFTSHPARAAQSYDNCTGFITSLPATISTQGVWCLNKDLATAITSGNAITINANNVTIDCNDFKIGGLAAGAGTSAVGIYAGGRQNLTVRHCNIRGFQIGFSIPPPCGDCYTSGHLVEDNVFDSNTQIGVQLFANNSIIRNNRVFDTGGSPLGGDVIGIRAHGSPIFVNDNFVSNTFGPNFAANTVGIWVSGYMSRAMGNTVYDTAKGSNGTAAGLAIGGTATSAERNLIGNVGVANLDYGIDTTYSVNCFDNRVYGATSTYDACNKVSGNYP